MRAKILGATNAGQLDREGGLLCASDAHINLLVHEYRLAEANLSSWPRVTNKRVPDSADHGHHLNAGGKY